MQQIEALAEGVQPLLAEVHDSTLVKDMENLTKSLAEATVDLRYNLLILPIYKVVHLFQILSSACIHMLI